MPVKTACFLLLAFLSVQPSLLTQESSRVTLFPKPSEDLILAVGDVQAAPGGAGTELATAVETFNRVLWDDLSFAGFFTIAGRGFYPPAPIVRPETDIDYEAWNAIPFKVSFLTVGTVSLSRNVLRAEVSVYDMKQRKRAFVQHRQYFPRERLVEAKRKTVDPRQVSGGNLRPSLRP